METLFSLLVGLLIAAGVFLLLSRSLVRVVLGLAFIGYGGNLAILTVAGLKTVAPPLLTVDGPYTDPLPQALILTAIVIGFATTALLLTVALRAYQVAGHADVENFGDSLARDPDAPDGLEADPEHQSPDRPDTEEAEAPLSLDALSLNTLSLEHTPPQIADAHEAAEAVTNEGLDPRVARELTAELSGEAHGGRK